MKAVSASLLIFTGMFLCLMMDASGVSAASRACERAQTRYDLAVRTARSDVDRLKRDAERNERSDEKLNAKAREKNRQLKTLFREIRDFRGQKLTRRFKSKAISTLNEFRSVARDLGRLQDDQAGNLRRDRGAMERLKAVASDLDRHAQALKSQCPKARLGKSQRWATHYESQAARQLSNLKQRLAHNRKTRNWLRDQDDWARDLINQNR